MLNLLLLQQNSKSLSGSESSALSKQLTVLTESSGDKEPSRESTPPSKQSLPSSRAGEFDHVPSTTTPPNTSTTTSSGLNGAAPEEQSTSPSMSMSPGSSHSVPSSPALDVDSAASMEPLEEENLSSSPTTQVRQERLVKKAKVQSTGEFAC